MKQIRISISEADIERITEYATMKSLSLSSAGRSLLVEKIREIAPKGGLTKVHEQS